MHHHLSIKWVYVLLCVGFSLYAWHANANANVIDERIEDGIADNSATLQLFAEEWPPYHYQKHDKIGGLNYEVVAQICRRAQVECDFTLIPWPRAYRMARQTEQSGVFSTMQSPERLPLFHWVGPIAAPAISLYQLSGDKDASALLNSEDRTLRIGTIRDTQERRILFSEKPHLRQKNLPEFLNQNTVYEALFVGRVDLVLGNKLSLLHYLNTNGLNYDRVQLVEAPGRSTEGTYLALNLSVPRVIVVKLNQALRAMKSEGQLAVLQKQYCLTLANEAQCAE